MTANTNWTIYKNQVAYTAPDQWRRRQSLAHQPYWPVFLGYGLAVLLSAGIFALIGYMLGFIGI